MKLKRTQEGAVMKGIPKDILETSSQTWVDFRKICNIQAEVVPVVVQDKDSKEVLIIAYVNQRALMQSIKTQIATFWSTSRNELWVKGATSGNMLKLHQIRINCEQNSLLFLVSLKKGGACHVKNKQGEYYLSCFYRKMILNKLYLMDV